MTTKKIIGILIIIIFIGALFAMTCYSEGVIEALKVWGASVILTAFVVGGVILATSD